MLWMVWYCCCAINSNSRTTSRKNKCIFSSTRRFIAMYCLLDVDVMTCDGFERIHSYALLTLIGFLNGVYLQRNEGAIHRHIFTVYLCVYYMHFGHMYSHSYVVYTILCVPFLPSTNCQTIVVVNFFFLYCVHFVFGGSRHILNESCIVTSIP